MDPASTVDTAPILENGEPWSPSASETLYRMPDWGEGYYSVNERGHVAVSPERSGRHPIDVYEVLSRLRDEHGVRPPVLLRFQDVLRDRVRTLSEAFQQAIGTHDYQNRYTSVYPIKVNQLREVVEEVLNADATHDVGLECGSKAELVAALSYMDRDNRLLICNGFKDRDMLRLILEGQRMGKSIVPVIEKYPEFEALLRLADERGLPLQLGARVCLETGGSGKWADSSGNGSKFGLPIADLLRIVERLEAEGRTDALTLLHVHIGSQVSEIQTLKTAVREVTQIYARLRARGVPVAHLDVGGGLGVHYGSGAGVNYSLNYTLQEYATAVVHTVQEVCRQQKVPEPHLISESGRALTAHHTVLVVEAVGVHGSNGTAPVTASGDAPSPLSSLHDTWEWVRALGPPSDASVPKLMAAHRKAKKTHQHIREAFERGHLSLDEKAQAEQVYEAIQRGISEHLSTLDPDAVPEELTGLDAQVVDQYLCSFSVFQSMLDHWAIEQPFPVMPLHRLQERPTRPAVLMDLTCDSDGKIGPYVVGTGKKDYLDVHPLRPNEPYYLGIFLTGAYQDIMGDVHNLFGRLPEAHIYADPEAPGGAHIEKTIPGDSVQSMLADVQYDPDQLQERVASMVREKVDDDTLDPQEGRRLIGEYQRLFDETTYYDPSS